MTSGDDSLPSSARHICPAWRCPIGTASELGGVFLRASVETAFNCRFFALPGGAAICPAGPRWRVASRTDVSIATEVWSLSPVAFGVFVSRIPAPLGIGTPCWRTAMSPGAFRKQRLRGADDIRLMADGAYIWRQGGVRDGMSGEGMGHWSNGEAVGIP